MYENIKNYRNLLSSEESKFERQRFNALLEADLESCGIPEKEKAIKDVMILPDNTDKQFFFKKWLWNNGLFRSEIDIVKKLNELGLTDNLEELSDKTIQERKAIIDCRERKILKENNANKEDKKYEEACNTRSYGAWAVLMIGFIISVSFWSIDMFITAVVIFMLSLLITIIALIVTSANNADDAKYYNLSESGQKRASEERLNAKVGTAAVIGGTAVTIHRAKKAGKELLDVEHWKDMK